jgi:hypothetical protein
LDIRGFNLNAILEIEFDFLTDVDHKHDDDATQPMRYKSILNIKKWITV